MSASTVSITANPGPRRRPVVVGEKKSNHTNNELAAAMTEAAAAAAAAAANTDRLVAVTQSKDLSHHSVMERTTDAAGPKIHKTIFPARRTRASTNHKNKPRWLTVVSVFTKNFVLLLVLIGLVQMVRRLALNSSSSSSSSSADFYSPQQMAAFSESEAKIAQLESFLKTSLKMIQLQVEVVNNKIDNQVAALTIQFENKLDDKQAQLHQLVSRFEVLDKSLTELKAADWLSRDDFHNLYNEFIKKGNAHLPPDFTLDDVRAYAKDIVLKEIEKHAADGLGMLDYALASGGAMVVKHSEPFSPGRAANWFLMPPRGGVHPDAIKMLQPSFGEPGHCFPLKGADGFVQISLRTPIIPQAFTLEHVAKSVAYDRSSAPKDCRVSGWLQGNDIDLAVDTEKMFLLTEFTYDLEKSSAQTFAVLNSGASGLVDTVRLDFASNHGSSQHTCIYRFRVHGYEPDSLSVMAMES